MLSDNYKKCYKHHNRINSVKVSASYPPYTDDDNSNTLSRPLQDTTKRLQALDWHI